MNFMLRRKAAYDNNLESIELDPNFYLKQSMIHVCMFLIISM